MNREIELIETTESGVDRYKVTIYAGPAPQVSYVDDPFEYDAEADVWKVIDAKYFHGYHMDNLYQYGQPFSSGGADSFLYDSSKPSIDRSQGDSKLYQPTVVLDQNQLFGIGVGNNIGFEDFDIVKNLQDGSYNIDLEEGRGKREEGREYTLSDLQGLGISSPEYKELDGGGC